MKKSSRFLAVILLALSVLLAACGGAKKTEQAPAPAPAGETKQPAAPAGDGSLDRVKKAGKLMVGMDTTYPPMEYVEGSTVVGFDVELANAIAAKMGVKAEVVTVDWNGIITGLLSKRYDVIISSMNITDERKKEVNFVEYARMSQVFVSTKGAQVKTEKDMAGKTVLVQDGTTSHDYVKEAKEQRVKDIKGIISYGGATEAFQALKNGKGEVVVIDEPVGLFYVKKDAVTFAITGRAIEPEPVGIAVRKEDAELTKALEKAVSDLRADGTYKKISESWFGGELGK
ncbi:MAG TPA: ABC transporter substrate-binding protein [Symbiobacteriaceae bacterium]|nr:ABC transporter substrate-binding protein [Symbiobacteriaceae bacterium]